MSARAPPQLATERWAAGARTLRSSPLLLVRPRNHWDTWRVLVAARRPACACRLAQDPGHRAATALARTLRQVVGSPGWGQLIGRASCHDDQPAVWRPASRDRRPAGAAPRAVVVQACKPSWVTDASAPCCRCSTRSTPQDKQRASHAGRPRLGRPALLPASILMRGVRAPGISCFLPTHQAQTRQVRAMFFCVPQCVCVCLLHQPNGSARSPSSGCVCRGPRGTMGDKADANSLVLGGTTRTRRVRRDSSLLERAPTTHVAVPGLRGGRGHAGIRHIVRPDWKPR